MYHWAVQETCVYILSQLEEKRDLTKAQSDLGLPQHSLVADCITRWGSQLHMIDRILEQEAYIRQLLATDRKHSHLIPTWQDLDVLESMRGALGPLEDFTDMLSGEKKSLCLQSNQSYIF